MRRLYRSGHAWAVFLLLLLATTTSGAPRRRRTQHKQDAAFDSDDYYAVLGLTRDAKTKEIKSAYRKLALKYHPDKVEEADKEKAESIFVKVSEAYAVLSDDDKRKIYDKYGKPGLEAYERGQDPEAAGFGAGGGFGGGGFGGGGPGGQRFHFQHGGGPGGGFDPFEMFASMFGDDFGGAGGGGGGNFRFQTSGGFPGGGFGGGFPGSAGGFAQGGGRGRQQPQQPTELFPKGEGNVAKLGSPKFPDASSKHLWLIVFYRNDVRECEAVKPHVDTLAEKVKGTYKVGAVNCGLNSKEAAFCKKKGITQEDLPAFAFVVDGKMNLFEPDEDDPPVPSSRDLHDFALDNMPKESVKNINHVTQVQDRLLDPIKKNKTLQGGVLLLTDKYETSALFYSLAYQFRSSLIFGESRAKNLALAKEFGVKKYPLLLVFVPKGSGAKRYNDKFDILTYEGSLKSQDIAAWLKKLPRRNKHTEL